MISALYSYFFQKRPENLKKCAIEKRRQFEELVDKLQQNDDEEDEENKQFQCTVDSDFKIDELGWNCTRHEGIVEKHFKAQNFIKLSLSIHLKQALSLA